MNFLSKKYKKIISIIFAVVVLISPSLAKADFSIVPCNPKFYSNSDVKGVNLSDDCGWEQLVAMGQNVINYSVVLMAILSVIGIAYAGFLYVTANGNSGQITKAHGIFIKIIWGIIFVLGAWLIVNTILKGLGYGKGEDTSYKSFLQDGSGDAAKNDD